MIVGESAIHGGPRRSFADRLVDHIQIIAALAEREIKSRFGRNALGYAWTYVLPLLWITVTYFTFKFFGRRTPVYTDTVTFIISGLIPYFGFRYVTASIPRVNGMVRGLLIFPSVTREHGVIAMALIDLVNIFIIYFAIAAANYMLFGKWELDDPLHFAIGVALAWSLGASYGYLFSRLALVQPTFEYVSQPILRPLIFLSGIFFTANELPEHVLEIFALNPILHAVEFARDGLLFHYQSRVASPLYVLGWTAGMLAAALVVRAIRRN